MKTMQEIMTMIENFSEADEGNKDVHSADHLMLPLCGSPELHEEEYAGFESEHAYSVTDVRGMLQNIPGQMPCIGQGISFVPHWRDHMLYEGGVPLDIGQGVSLQTEICPVALEIADLLRNNSAGTSGGKSIPDITEGLGKRQESRDLVLLEDFAVQHADWLIFDGILCVYKKTRWIKLNSEKDGIREIRRIFQPHEEIRGSLTAQDYKRLYNGLLSNPSLETLDVLNTPENCINCLDGVLNLLTLEARPHRPSDHYFYCFNLSCYEIQSPPEYGRYFENFVTQVGDGNMDVRRQILELIALAMTGKQLKVFYAMLGPSNCGKSQIGKFLEELLGRENVMVVRHIDDFAGSFTVGSLYGKLLGMCLDLPSGTLPQAAIAILKQLVGSDPVKGERKYANPFMFDVKPLLLLAGNHPIQVNRADREDAFFNRLVTIPFANPVSDSSEVIIDLYKHFLDEAAYIVHEACLAFRDLEERNWKPTQVPVPAEFSQRESDDKFLAVQDFVENCITLSPNSKVATASLFKAYQSYAVETGQRMLSETVFQRTIQSVLNRTMPSSKYIKAIYNNGPRGYRNIALLNDK